MHPLVLLAPVANYIYLRYFNAETEVAGVVVEKGKNSVWPAVEQVKNPAVWSIVGAGIGGVLVEQALRGYFRG